MNLNTSLDFAGIAGQFELSISQPPSYHVTYIDPWVPYRLGGIDTLVPTWCVQFFRPRAARIPLQCSGASLPVVTWAGTIWKITQHAYADEATAIRELLIQNACRTPPNDIPEIDGDFVASVVTADYAVLLSSITSTIPLFYKVDQNKLRWSTNLADLLDATFDLDTAKLAYMAWGADAIPYAGIRMLRRGEYVRLDRRGFEHGSIRYETERFDSEFPAQSASLPELGEYTWHLLRESVAKQANRFRRIGVVLSGGIDSSAIASCLADIGADVICYNWSSQGYPPADESRYAQAVTDYLKIPLKLIDVERYRHPQSDFIDEEWQFTVPYNHMLYRWWYDTVQAANEDGVECLMSGRFADSMFGPNAANSGACFSLFSGARSLGLRKGIAFLYHGLSIPLETSSLLWLQPSNHDGVESGNTLPVGRQTHHYTAQAQEAVMHHILGEQEGMLQSPALDVNLVRPADLVLAAPYLDLKLLNFTGKIPSGYQVLPYGGRLIEKAVLRYAFFDRLPPEIIKRDYRQHFEGITQQYCQNNKGLLQRLLDQESYLVKYGIIDHERLLATLQDAKKLYSSHTTIVINCMIELWLKSMEKLEAGRAAS